MKNAACPKTDAETETLAHKALYIHISLDLICNQWFGGGGSSESAPAATVYATGSVA